MKKLLMILTVTAFAVVANAGEACCAAKKEVASAATCSAKAATCSAQAATCSAKAASCSASTASCSKNGAQKVAVKQLKSPRHASQS